MRRDAATDPSGSAPGRAWATFAAYYQTSLYAGGDYYDVFPLPDTQFGVIVADVSGHGAPSAIVMAMIRAAVHAFPGFACDPAGDAGAISIATSSSCGKSPMFATVLSALIDPRDPSVTIACAGHPPPLLLRDGRVSMLPVDATMPVLMMDLPKVPDVRHALQSGDRLLFYTDGVTERPDPTDDMYDLPRLMAALERTSARTPADQVLAIVKDLDAFAAGREPDDDQTLLSIEIDMRDGGGKSEV